MRKLALCLLALSVISCASGKKKKDTPELSELEGKRVALLEVSGETTARKIVEVALINQLIQRGTFILVSKLDLERARTREDIDPRDDVAVGKAVNADLTLRANVLKFDAQEREGYSREKVYDSQLAEERGEDEAETDRLYKVKSLSGEVKVELEFRNLQTGDITKGIAQAADVVTADARKSAIRLPPRLGYLQKLANQAFHDFFEKYR